VGIPRRLGRLARGFVSTLQEDERLNERVRETIRNGRESGESFKSAFGAAWRGAAEEWRASEAGVSGSSEQKRESQRGQGQGTRTSSRPGRAWIPRKYPPKVIAAYQRLGLDTGTGLEEVHRKRRELVKRYHPDRFSDPEKRVKAERLTAQINAAHDTIRRHSARSL
jgi:DnaJ-domain-containing protein 1